MNDIKKNDKKIKKKKKDVEYFTIKCKLKSVFKND